MQLKGLAKMWLEISLTFCEQESVLTLMKVILIVRKIDKSLLE